MKEYSYLFASLFVLSTLSLSADQMNSSGQNQQMPPKPEGVTAQPQGVITPPVGPMVRFGADPFITFDFIWWKTHLSGTEYAASGVADGGAFVPFGTDVKRGKVQEPDFDFKPGFKLGGGLHLAHDGWDLYANYTWLADGQGRNSVSASEDKGVASIPNMVLQSGISESTNLSSASSKWKQNFNVLDLEMGRNFFISRFLTLRPHFGLKGAWINQRLKVNYETLDFGSVEQSRRQRMWGLGIRAGLDTVWHFSRNFGAYGDIALATVWSDFHSKATDENAGVNTLRTRDIVLQVSPVFEAGLGLVYMTWFHQDKYEFLIQAGWEEQVWFDFNHFVNFPKGGNLSFQGLTVKAGFSF